MIITVDKYLFIKEMNEYQPEKYSYSGLECLFEYCDEMYNELDEFDAVEIACSCNEYGKHCMLNWNDLINDYGYIYPMNEYCEDHDINSVIDESDYINELVEVMKNKYIILTAWNGNILIIE